MKRRATIIVSGTVQEAGYREEVAETAFDLHLKGQVQNLDDGTVGIICEGERSAIRELTRRINFRAYPVEVQAVRTRYLKPTGEFQKFAIIKDTRLDADVSSKMETGFRFIKHMHRDLAGAIRGVGSDVRSIGSDIRRVGTHVRKVGTHVRKVGTDVRRVGTDVRGVGTDVRRVGTDVRDVGSGVKTMNRDTGRRFDRLDRTYGRFGRTLKTVSKDMKGMAKDTKGAKSSMAGMASDMKGMAADIKVIRTAATAGRPRRKPARAV